jgi:Calpain family cysteine protease
LSNNRLFGSTELNKEGQYQVSVSNKGKLEPILIDEKVPVEEEGDRMFVVESKNHCAAREAWTVPKQTRFGSPKIKANSENEVEIWPQLLSKAKAKSLGCYERLLNQEILNLLADLTGMPVKTYYTNELDFKWLREGFKRSCIMICKANRKWINQCKPESVEGSTENELQYWNLSQVVQLSDGQLMIEIKHHLCDKYHKKSITLS